MTSFFVLFQKRESQETDVTSLMVDAISFSCLAGRKPTSSMQLRHEKIHSRVRTEEKETWTKTICCRVWAGIVLLIAERPCRFRRFYTNPCRWRRSRTISIGQNETDRRSRFDQALLWEIYQDCED